MFYGTVPQEARCMSGKRHRSVAAKARGGSVGGANRDEESLKMDSAKNVLWAANELNYLWNAELGAVGASRLSPLLRCIMNVVCSSAAAVVPDLQTTTNNAVQAT